ncbi:hypothetical protein SPRG_22273 [Saprolegnia parasitica CBS 223.65]|uniref:Cytochrome P450 n=1 Tax=Saprolegnia parasitica (strain CBS 223.65) TaxID=695850 RepID=A0A067C349_SAPPC|nr:hypothetical protein SPRG_22273 [Saprolegnia parasitica CBS 223.65]KDO21197.1 hypothetical protein SPRG_22273 [Saprolegnia parasitica CBS 223.65]|eukprot:XP_012208119.1 hypothetical protein SPRG_22273 [Saprolegnia parasitica CBS 223.65]
MSDVTSTTLVVLASLVGLVLLWTKPHSNIPLVSYWIPFVGSSLAFSKDPIAFLNMCQATHGSVFTVLLAGRRMTFFTSPKHYATILKSKSLSHKPIFSEIEEVAFGQDPVFTHYRNDLRKTDANLTRFNSLPTPFLANRGAVLDLIQRTFACQRAVLATLAPQQHGVSLLTLVEHAIFASGSAVMFGERVLAAHPRMADDFLAFDAAFPLLVAGCVPSVFLSKAMASRQRLIDAFKAAPLTDGAPLVQARASALPTLACGSATDRASCHLEILWAASANSIPTAFWTLFHLLESPAALKAVRDEIDTHLDKSPLSDTSAAPWTQEMLHKCVLLDSTVDECLRLAASSMLLRVAVEPTDVVLDKTTYHFEKGDRVAIFPSLGHFDPTLFSDPTRFQYDRFVHATKAQLEAFKPFGMGANMCPGRYFAKNQIKMWVALVLQHLPALRLVPGYTPPTFDPSRLGLGVIPPADHAIHIAF